jgi:hypothetical protein
MVARLMHKKELVEERLLEADKQLRLGRPVIACDRMRTGPRYANVLVVQHAAGVRHADRGPERILRHLHA